MLRMLSNLPQRRFAFANRAQHSISSSFIAISIRFPGGSVNATHGLCRGVQDSAPRMPTLPGASSQDTQRAEKELQPAPNPLHESAFVSDDTPVHDVPMHVIHRPLQSTTDESKVKTFVKEMQRGDDFTPIEVLWVQRGDADFYFAFGGCHRWEAHKRLNRPTIKAKLVKTTAKSLSIYLGRDPFA